MMPPRISVGQRIWIGHDANVFFVLRLDENLGNTCEATIEWVEDVAYVGGIINAVLAAFGVLGAVAAVATVRIKLGENRLDV